MLPITVCTDTVTIKNCELLLHVLVPLWARQLHAAQLRQENCYPRVSLLALTLTTSLLALTLTTSLLALTLSLLAITLT